MSACHNNKSLWFDFKYCCAFNSFLLALYFCPNDYCILEQKLADYYWSFICSVKKNVPIAKDFPVKLFSSGKHTAVSKKHTQNFYFCSGSNSADVYLFIYLFPFTASLTLSYQAVFLQQQDIWLGISKLWVEKIKVAKMIVVSCYLFIVNQF